MKRMIVLLMITLFSLVTMPAFGEMPKPQKDECLLASKNCMDQVDDLQKRIKKLNKEIKKGKKVYSAEDLQKLADKLKEANSLLKNLEGP